MGISSALYSGISGLNTNGNAMSVIGNNIANTNTVGFKGARTVFSDILSSTVSGSGGTSQVGRGTQLSTVDNIFSQGTFESTESATDLAIEGESFFMIGVPGTAEVRYTRAGAFRFDNQGFMVNAEGLRVQGKQFLTDGTMSIAAPSDIRVDNTVQVSANPTANVTLTTNLDANSAVGPVFDPADPLGTSNYAASLDMFDSLGNTHLLTTYFTKTSTNQWDWNTVATRSELAPFATLRADIAAADTTTGATVVTDLNTLLTNANITLGAATAAAAAAVPADPDLDYAVEVAQAVVDEATVAHGAAVTAQGAGDTGPDTLTAAMATTASQPTVMVVGRGAVSFDSSGVLQSGATGTTFANALNWNNGADATLASNLNFNTTQNTSASVVIGQDQDGYGAGELVKVSIDNEGTIIGNYSNGENIKVGRVALAKFSNPGGLEGVGGNMYAETGNSGAARVGTAGSSMGKVFTNSLEQSNVDLAQEFVKMITTQRGFQANSRVITTTDEMLGELINLKR